MLFCARANVCDPAESSSASREIRRFRAAKSEQTSGLPALRRGREAVRENSRMHSCRKILAAKKNLASYVDFRPARILFLAPPGFRLQLLDLSGGGGFG